MSKTHETRNKIQHKYASAQSSVNKAQCVGQDADVLNRILDYAFIVESSDPISRDGRFKKYRKWWHRLKQKKSASDLQLYSVLEFLPAGSDRVPSRKLKEMIGLFLECYEMAYTEPKESLTFFISYIVKPQQHPVEDALAVDTFREYFGHYFLLSLFLHPTIEYESRVSEPLAAKILGAIERIMRPHRISNRLGYREYSYLIIRTKQIYSNAHKFK